MTTTLSSSSTLDLATTARGRGWAWAGVGAGVAGIIGIGGSMAIDAVYRDDIAGDAEAIQAALAEQTTQILVFHTATMVAALLVLVFAAGLRRHLGERLTAGSLLPTVAFSGLMLVSVAGLIGTGLTTEFVFGASEPGLMVPEVVAFFGHWVGTMPWLWVGAGVAALAVAKAGRDGADIPRWLTWFSLVLGGLTTVFGISPLQYMAGMVGPLWLVVASFALVSASRRH